MQQAGFELAISRSSGPSFKHYTTGRPLRCMKRGLTLACEPWIQPLIPPSVGCLGFPARPRWSFRAVAQKFGTARVLGATPSRSVHIATDEAATNRFHFVLSCALAEGSKYDLCFSFCTLALPSVFPTDTSI